MNIYKVIARSLLYFSFIFFVIETFIPSTWSIWVKDHMIYINVLFIAFMEAFGEKIIYMIASLFKKNIDGSLDYKGKHSKNDKD